MYPTWWLRSYLFESKTEDRRKVGRARSRWLEDVENDLQELKWADGRKRQIMKKNVQLS
jgi:hypothetical protein